VAAVGTAGRERALSLRSGLGREAAIDDEQRRLHGRPHFAIDAGDDLIEEYSGFGLRFESRKLGTERLGVFFEWSTYDSDWRDPTLFAVAGNPAIPPLYRNRMNVTPLAKFAITPHLTVSGGSASPSWTR
jgi:hypothetical protein